MSKFLNMLDVELMWGADGIPLKNRDDRQLFMVLSDFLYQSDIAGKTFTIPKGFVTDFASVPQFALSIFGEIAQAPSLPHDYLYSTGKETRLMADQILREACLVTGVSWWKTKLIYAGVRAGGGSHFGTS